MSSLSNNTKLKKNSEQIIFKVLRQIAYTKLFKKYSSGNFSFSKISINHLICNESTQVVARFKDFLIYDDTTEFLRRFYFGKEATPRLKKILNFYETYSKIFPNYLVIKENKYLYRNIRKKQKMIDAINEIKREEKENKKKLGIKNDKNKKLNNIKDANNELFTPKIKDEIKIFQQNLCGKIIQNSFDTDNQNEDNTLLINSNSISISILNWKEFEKKGNNMTNENNLNNMNTNIDSFITNKEDESITKMLSILNDNKIYIKDLPILFMENKYINTTPNIKREIKSIRIKNKKIIKNNTNGICKYAKTSSNTTTTSALLSKRIKTANILSSAKKKNLKSNKDDYNNNKVMISKQNTNNNNINIKNNNVDKLYPQMSPQLQGIKNKPKYFHTNSNFRYGKNINNTEKKENLFVKSKKISQDFNTNSNKIKKFLTENNPKNNSKNNEKVHVNLRDIIKSNKHNEICKTEKKHRKKGTLVLKLTKNKINSNSEKIDIKFNENEHSQHVNSLSNLHCNKIRPKNDNQDSKKNTNFNHQKKKSEKSKSKNKKLLTKELTSKTKSIFNNEKKSNNEIIKSKYNNNKMNNLKKNETNLNKSKNIKRNTPLKNNTKNIKSLIYNSNNINNVLKTTSNGERKNKYKSFLTKKMDNNNQEKNHFSSINILNNDSRIKSPNISKIKHQKSNSNIIKTPGIINKKVGLFKKSNTTINRRFHNLKTIKEKKQYIETYTIKVNKTYYNKNKNLAMMKDKSNKNEKIK